MLAVDVRLTLGGFSLDAAFELNERVTGVFGPSAAGKTTLLHLIAGLERPRSGRIVLDGETLFDAEAGTDAPAHRRRVGLVFQEGRLFPHYSVRGNLRYGMRSRRRSRNDSPDVSFDDVVDLLALEPLLARRVWGLSGGERQRVALGRALLSAPRLLLLDEPLASLDRVHRRQILPFLRRLPESVDIPILYVSHDITDILQLTDHLILMQSGRVVGCGRYLDLAHDQATLGIVHDLGMTNVLELGVREHDAASGLTQLGAPSGGDPDAHVFLAPLRGSDGPANVFVSIRPQDIALALHRVAGLSIQNQIPGIVRRVMQRENRALAEVDVKHAMPLLAEISLKTVRDLRIEAGRVVWCLIKSNAISYLDH